MTTKKTGKANAKQATTQDTLTISAAKAGLSKEAFDAVRKWLTAQLLANVNAKLSQGGHKEENVALSQVFVDLPLEQQDHGRNTKDQYFLEKFLAAKPLFIGAQRAFEQASGQLFADELEQGRRAKASNGTSEASFSANILIGGPGQGKSTLGQLACQLHRAALLTPLLAQLSSESQRDLVRSFAVAKNGKDKTLALPAQAMLPLQIPLPDFSAWLVKQAPASSAQSDAVPSLLRFLAAQPGARQCLLEAETLLALCTHMPVLLVLDGFDEVGATEDRQALVAAGRALLDYLARVQTSVKLIAATRPQGYGGELAQLGIAMPERVLAPLSLKQAMAYANKLVAAKVPDHDQQQKLLVRLEEAAKNQNTQRLLGTPLQVTIMTALVQQYGRAPRERWQLFHKYYNYTFDREIERNTYASDLLHDHRARIDKIHTHVALLLQVEAERAGGGAARMPRTKLEEVIQTVLQKDEVAEREQGALVAAIAKAAEQRLVFLVEPEPGAFGFEIRSLQEFMAAWALTTGREEALKARIAQIAAAPMFRNVALFIASRWYSDDTELADLFTQEVCCNLDQGGVGEAASVTCAGALFALELLEEGVALGQPKRARALMIRATGLLSLPPSVEHARLANAANSDTEIVLQAALERQFNSVETVDTFPAWICVLAGCKHNAAWATALGERYWHKLPDLTRLLRLIAELRLTLNDWLAKMMEPAVAQIPPEALLEIPAERNRHWSAALATFYDHIGSVRVSGLHYAPVGDCYSATAAQFPLLPNSPWHAWQLAMQYEIAPTAMSLANVLNAVAESLPQSDWPTLGQWSSWPLAVCLASAGNGSDLRRYAALARAGELGDAVDWLAAQQRGLDLAGMLECLNDLPELWTVQTLQKSLPIIGLRSSSFSYGYDRSQLPALPVLAKLDQAFVACPFAKLKQHLAELCLGFLYCLNEDSKVSVSDPLRWLKANTENPAALVPRPSVLSNQDWLRVLAQSPLPCRTSILDLYFTETIRDIFLAATSHPVVLRAAILFSKVFASDMRRHLSLSETENFIKALSQYQATSTTERTEISILQTRVGALPANRDDSFITDLAEAALATPMLWQAAIVALSAGDLSAPRASALLLQIYQRLGPSHEQAGRIVDAIRKHQLAHKSGLEAPETWQELALPPPAPELAVPAPAPVPSQQDSIIPQHPIHLQSLEVKHIRGLQDLAFNFYCPAPEQGQWVVLLGPNGVGKTTLLRSLAVSLRNVKDPGIWPQNAFNPWRASGSEAELASIKVVTAHHGTHVTSLSPAANQFEQVPEQKAQPLFPLFAYGCRRGSALGGSKTRPVTDESNGQEIATLFDEDADLLQAETWLISLEGDTQRNPQSKIIYDAVVDAIKTLLNVAAVEVENRRVMVTEHDRARLPLDALSDGYLTSAGWFLDLIARWLDLAMRHQIAIGADFMQTMRGLVLIDEIDLHLHPQWQIEIIARTRELLPQMSFIVSSHNPLTLVGAEAQEIWILENHQGSIRATQCEETPMLLTGGQLYRRYFGIADIYPKGLGRDVERYTFLASYALRTDAEQAELEQLGEKLRAAKLEPDVDIVEREFLEPPMPPTPKQRTPRKSKKVVP